jgi:hypothetical protein
MVLIFKWWEYSILIRHQQGYEIEEDGLAQQELFADLEVEERNTKKTE